MTCVFCRGDEIYDPGVSAGAGLWAPSISKRGLEVRIVVELDSALIGIDML